MTDPSTLRPAPALIQSRGGSNALPGFQGLKEHWHHCQASNSHLHFYTNAPGVGPSSGPVLLLAHGWPQTSFTWRYVIPALQSRIRLFVTDQPGAAHSTLPSSGSKRVLGAAYMEALAAHYGAGTKVVLGGHDRGGRIVQRIAVSRHEEPFKSAVDVLGALVIDIVPIAAQFQSFGREQGGPSNASRYFHWSFLPLTDLSVRMIMAFGAEEFNRVVHERTRGQAAQARENLERDGALDVYAAWYGREDTNQAGAEDYRAAAQEDYDEMLADQKEGKKVDVPLRVLHGDGLAAMHDVAEVWKGYVKEEARLQVDRAPEGHGHNLQEEAPEWVVGHFEKFLAELGV